MFGRAKKILFNPTNQGIRTSDITKRSYGKFKESYANGWEKFMPKGVAFASYHTENRTRNNSTNYPGVYKNAPIKKTNQLKK